MKKLLSLLVVMLLTVTMFAGCGAKKTEETNDAAKTEETIKLGLFMSHRSNAFTTQLSNAAEAAAKEMDVEMTVFDGEKDVAKQISQIETAITQGVSGIIVEPASVDGIAPAIKAAKEAGIPVVTINQQITDKDLADCFVGVAHVDGGRLEMEKAAKDLGAKGNIAVLYGPMGSDGQIGRDEGYQLVLKDNADMRIVFNQAANWNTDEALKLAENWLQTGTEINAFVAQNDSMALGALKAVEDANLQDSILVYGVDATPDALQAVKDGRLAATVSQNTNAQGKKGVETCIKLIKGEEVKKEIIVEHKLITKDNVDEFLK